HDPAHGCVGEAPLAARIGSTRGPRAASPHRPHECTPRMQCGHGPTGHTDVIRIWPASGQPVHTARDHPVHGTPARPCWPCGYDLRMANRRPLARRPRRWPPVPSPLRVPSYTYDV
ncbi:hypothetical protein PanWU01x14_111850, partial [Parasponia andersonii]